MFLWCGGMRVWMLLAKPPWCGGRCSPPSPLFSPGYAPLSAPVCRFCLLRVFSAPSVSVCLRREAGVCWLCECVHHDLPPLPVVTIHMFVPVCLPLCGLTADYSNVHHWIVHHQLGRAQNDDTSGRSCPWTVVHIQTGSCHHPLLLIRRIHWSGQLLPQLTCDFIQHVSLLLYISVDKNHDLGIVSNYYWGNKTSALACYLFMTG